MEQMGARERAASRDDRAVLRIEAPRGFHCRLSARQLRKSGIADCHVRVDPADVGTDAQVARGPEVDADIEATAGLRLIVPSNELAVGDGVEGVRRNAGIWRDKERRR